MQALIKRYDLFFFTLFLSFFFFTTTAVAQPTSDAAAPGPHAVASGEYRLPAKIDDDILPSIVTEVWAKVFYPQDIQQMKDKAPLIVLLHGNHPTCGKGTNPRHDDSCDYTLDGVCPAGYVVTPNHEGYNYFAQHLASWGYWVVSINANRGINCNQRLREDFGLNLARGKLVLRHLSQLYQWSTKGEAPLSLGLGEAGLVNKIDFASVGLFGHSRGGEGVRAAYNLYVDKDSIWPAQVPGLKIKAIFEIGAVDGQTSRVLNANGVAWNQILPMCDGDVYDLAGRYPFDRMLLNPNEPATAQKSLFEVWGANHNFFNTEWQQSESSGCLAGDPLFDPEGMASKKQQYIALASVSAFFRSHLGNEQEVAFNQVFNPLEALSARLSRVTQIDRDFTPSPGASETSILEDFDKETGVNSAGYSNEVSQLMIEHRYLNQNNNLSHPQRVGEIKWQAAGVPPYFETVFEAKGAGRDLRGYATLDFRVGRTRDESNKTLTSNFHIQLKGAKGHLSEAVSADQYVLLNGPGNHNPILQTVRIPLSVFRGVKLNAIHAIRFTFDDTATGNIYLANIRANRQRGLGTDTMTRIPAAALAHVAHRFGAAAPLLFQLAKARSAKSALFAKAQRS